MSANRDLYAGPTHNTMGTTIAPAAIMDHLNPTGSIGGARQMQGTLSSRLRTLVSDAVDGMTQQEWREKALIHPAYPLILEELQMAYNFKILDKVMDQLEELGCVVTYDRSTAQLTLGLNAKNLCKGFTERLAMVDVRNKRLIDQANGVTPMNRFMDSNPKAQIDDIQVTATYYLTFGLNPEF